MEETVAERVKREVLGIGERLKHHTRKATPLKSRAKTPGTHHRIDRFRFYPTEEQAEQLERTFGACERCREPQGREFAFAGRVERGCCSTDRRAVGRNACGVPLRPIRPSSPGLCVVGRGR
ncbi:helix-turn-helix domain-containing protein [Streptomyces sp. NPDC097941]|uniref:helix-turn-helix domain-containing protein n=1 Tax=Streptomyces sp. NPDC097941 TaxID=3155685 RepID=UPI003316881C